MSVHRLRVPRVPAADAQRAQRAFRGRPHPHARNESLVPNACGRVGMRAESARHILLMEMAASSPVTLHYSDLITLLDERRQQPNPRLDRGDWRVATNGVSRRYRLLTDRRRRKECRSPRISSRRRCVLVAHNAGSALVGLSFDTISSTAFASDFVLDSSPRIPCERSTSRGRGESFRPRRGVERTLSSRWRSRRFASPPLRPRSRRA